MRIIIDGYNLLFKMFNNEKINSAREKIIQILKDFLEKKRDVEIILFFDGNEKSEAITKDKKLTIIFTKKGKTADLEISKYVEKNDPNNAIVITSDKMVFSKVTNKGFVVLFTEEFIGILNAILNAKEFNYFFRNKKNESKREQVIKWLIAK